MALAQISGDVVGFGDRAQCCGEVDLVARQVVVAGNPVRIDAAAGGVEDVGEHGGGKLHLEADQRAALLLAAAQSGADRLDPVIGGRQSEFFRRRERLDRKRGLFAGAPVLHPQEIRMRRIVDEDRRSDFFKGTERQ